MTPSIRTLVFPVLLAITSVVAQAQTTFANRYSANIKGDIVFVSNASMTCSAATGAPNAATCAAAQNNGVGNGGTNNSYRMNYIDTDSDASTFNSTSAQLAMPAGSTVAWAGLYWAGDSKVATRTAVKIKGPTATTYTNLTATQTVGIGTQQYQGFIDVTNYVASQGNGNYTIANIESRNGAQAVYAGWTIVVAYQNAALPTRNLVVYDGYQRVASNTPGGGVNVSLSGFLTPPIGPVTSRIGTIAYDGDRGSAEGTAGLQFGQTATTLSPVFNAQNPQTDYFNSTISRDGANVTTRNSGYTNTFGYDADISQPNTPLPNGATTAVVRVSSSSETIDLGVVTMVTDIFVPNIKDTLTKKVNDVNGGVLLPGEVIEYELSFGNTGQDPAINVVLSDAIPVNTTYVPSSIVIVSGANSGVKTDAAGDDQAEFDAAGNKIVIRAGVGATATQGGKITPGDPFTVIRFKVKVNPGVPGDTVIENSAKVTFKAQTLGTVMTDVSDSNPSLAGDQPATIVVASADLTIAKSHVGNFNAGQTGQTYSVLVTNSGTSPTNAPIQMVDTLPAGLTATAILGGPSWSCTLASLTCVHAGVLAVGQAAPAITITVNVALNAPASVINTATVSGGGEGASKTANNVANDPTTITQGFPVSKTFTPPAVSTTQASKLTITVTNPSSLGAINGLVINDVLPAGVIVAPVPNASIVGCGALVFAPTASATSLTATAGSISASTSCVITVDVVAAVAGSYTNTIPVNGVTTSNFGSNTTPASSVLTVAAPDLKVVKTSTSPFYRNQTTGASFTMTASNAGSGASVGAVTVTDTLEAGLTPLSATGTGWSCTVTGQLVSCSRGDALAAGASYAPITVAVSVASNAALSLNNTAQVAGGGEPTGNANNNTSTIPIVVLAPPTVTKTFTPNAINLGGNSVMLITITNPNSVALQGVGLTDNYPPNLLNAASPAATTTCAVGTLAAAANTASAVLTGASVAASASCTITVTVAPSAAGSTGAYVNTIAAGAVTSANAGSNVAPASATLNVSAPDLTIAKTHTGNFYVGQTNATFTLTVSNNGANGNGASIGQVTVSDTLPAGLVPQTATGSGWGPGAGACSVAGQVVTCVRSDALAYGAAYPPIIVTTSVNSAAVPSVTNTASVSGGAEPAANSTNNSASDTVTVLASPTVSKSFAVSNTSLLTPVVMTITISNPNAIAMTSVNLTDNYPVGLQNAAVPNVTNSCVGTTTATALATSLTIAAGTIPANASCVITVNVQATQVGSLTNTVPVGGVSTGNSGSNSAPASATLSVAEADLTLTKSHVGNFYQGQTGAVFTLSAKNSGAGSTAGVIEVVDTLPVGLTPTAAGGAGWGPQAGNQCTIAGQVVTCQYTGVLLSNASASFTVTVAVAANAASTLINTAKIAGGGELATAQTNNAASDTVTVLASPRISKSFTPVSASANQSVALAITIHNDNAVALSGLAFIDNLPGGVVASALVSNTCNGSATFTANSVSLSAGSVAANASCVITYTTSAAAAGVYVNTIPAGALSSTQAGASQQLAQATLTVQAANLSILKSHVGTFYQGQGNASFTIQVSNVGAGATDGTPIIMKDILPAGLTPVSATGGGWTCGFVGQEVTCTMTTVLAAGLPASPITLIVAVAADAAASLTNTASVSGGGEPESSTKDNSSSDTVTVFANPKISKSFSPPLVSINQSSVMTVTITNPNALAISGVAFNDAYPTGLVNASVINLQNTCGGAVTAVSGQSSLSVTNGSIAANSSCTVSLQVSAAAAGGYTNTILANGLSTAQAGGNPSATSATLNVAGPDLAISKTHTGNFYKNQIGATFQITVRNAGIGATAGVVSMADTLPGTLTATAISGSGWTCTLAPLVCSRSDSLPAGQSYPVITVTVNVSDLAAPTESNRVEVTGGGEPAANVNNNVATDQVTILANPTLLKSFTPASINANNPSELLLTLSNSNAVAITGAALSDIMPSGLTLLAAPTTSCAGTLSSTATSLTLSGGLIPANSSCTIRVPVTGASAGSYTNSLAAGALTSNNAGSSQTPATAVLTIAAPDLIISKSHSGHFYQRQAAATYALEVKNIGAGATNGAAIVVTDTLPTGLSFVSATGSGWVCTSAISCTYTSATPLAVGASLPIITVTVSVAANAPSTLTNTASVAGGGEPAANAANNSASDLTKVLSNPTVVKSFSPTSGNIGGVTRLTVVISNANDVAMTGVSFTDTYGINLLNAPTPAATSTCGGIVVAVAGQATLALTGTTIAPGANCEISSNVTTAVAGNHTNTLPANSVSSSNAGANQLPASANYAAASPDLTIVKNHVSTFYQGQSNATFTLTVSNVGVSPSVGGVTVSDTLPAGLTMVSMAGAGWTCSPITGPCTRTSNDNLAAGASYPVLTVTVNVDVSASASLINLAAVTNSTEPSANLANNSTSDTVTVLRNPTVMKSFSSVRIFANDVSTLTITVSNPNAVAITGVSVADTFPASITIANPANAISSCGGSVTAVATTSVVTLSGATISAAGTCTLTVNVTAIVPGEHLNTIPAGGVTSTNAGNNATPATAILTVLSPDLVVAKSHTGSFFQGQSGVNYLLTVTNIGFVGTNATQVTVTDIFPTGITPVAASGTGWLCSVTGQTVACNRSDVLAPGAAYPVVTVIANVLASAVSVTNTASVLGGGEAPSLAANNTASDPTVVLTPIQVSKSFSINPITAGQTTNLLITLSNSNTTPISPVGLTDNMPSALKIVGAASLNCSGMVGAVLNTSVVTVTNLVIPGLSTCVVSVPVTSSSVGAWVNTIATSDVTPNIALPAQATLTVNAPNLLINKTHVGTFYAGQMGAQFVLTVSNVGNTSTTGATVTVVDTLPVGLTPKASTNGNGWACSVVGQQVSCTRSGPSAVISQAVSYPPINVIVDVAGNAAGNYVNTATVEGGGEVDTSNNLATDTVMVLRGLSMTKQFSVPSISPNQRATLTITVINPNPVAITGVTLLDTFPSSPSQMLAVTAPTTSCGGTVQVAAGNTAVSLSAGSVPANSNCVMTVGVTASTSGVYLNTIPAANLTSANAGTATVDASDSLTVAAPDWVLSKIAVNAPFFPGQTTAQFDLTARNIGNANALAGQLLTVTDTFPAGIVPTAIASAVGWTCTVNAPIVSCTRSDALATGASHPVISITTTVAASAAGSLTNTASLAGGGDNNPANNVGTTAFEILKSPQISKSFAPASAQINQVIQLTIELKNTNTVALLNAAFTDTLPTGLTLATVPGAVTNCGGSVSAASLGVSVAGTGMTIPSAGCFVRVNVIAVNPGAYSNVIPVGALSTSNGGVSQAAAQATLQISAPDLTIAKRSNSVFWRGQTSGANYALSISNIGGAATNNTVNVVDVLPAGLTPTAAAGVGWTCGIAGQQVSCQRTGATTDALAVGASYPDIVINVSVARDAGQSIVNTANVLGGGEAPSVTGNNSATDIVVVNANPVVRKSFAPSSMSLGQTATMEIVISNPNANAMTGVSFNDAYPAGLINAAIPNASASCTGTVIAGAGGNSTVLSAATIPANSQCTVKVDVTTTANAAPGAYINSLPAGSVSSTNAGDNPVGASGTLNLASPDLVIGKTHVGDFYQRQTNAKYLLKVSNQGSGNTLGAIVVKDTLPVGLTPTAVAGSGWSCSIAGQLVTCSRNDVLQAGQQLPVIEISVSVAGNASTVINTATVEGGSESLAAAQNNGVTDPTTVLANPTLLKSFASPSAPINAPVLMTFTIANSNNVAVTGVGLTDTLPTGMQFAPNAVVQNTCGGSATLVITPSYKITLNNASLAAASTCSIKVEVITTSTAVLTNTIPMDGLTSTNAGGNPLPAVATLTGFVTAPKGFKAVVLKQDADASGTASPGDVLEWVVIYANTQAGAVSRTGFQIADVLPTGVVLEGVVTVVATGGASVAGANAAYTGLATSANLLTSGAVLDVGGIVTVRIPVRILPNFEGMLVNQTSATGSGLTAPILSSALDTTTPTNTLPPSVLAPSGSLPVPQTTNNSATQVPVTMPNRVGTSKAVVSSTQVSGSVQRVVYDVLVKNFGTQAAPNVQLQDSLALSFPSPVTFVVLTPPALVSGVALSLNSGFNGVSDNRLLAGTTALPAGASSIVRVTVLVTLNGSQTTFNNSSFASSKGGADNQGGVIAAPATVGGVPSFTPSIGMASFDASNNAVRGATPSQLEAAADPSANSKPNDAGEDTPTPITLSFAAALRGSVWLDATPNRVRDGNEQGVANFGVEIINAVSNIAVSCVAGVNTTIGCITMPDGRSLFATNAAGNYEALGLPTGNYQVRFRDGANNIIYGTPANSSNNPASSVASNREALLVTLSAGDAILEQNLPLDPSGVVYNSSLSSRQAIAGATVTFCGPSGFVPLTMLVGGSAYASVAGQPNCASMVVGSNGFYQYLLQPSAPSGRYTLSASAPNYFGPSTVIPAQTNVPVLPPAPGFFAVQTQITPPTGSQATTYYLTFNLSIGVQDVVNNHIPLDPLNNARLFVSKTVNQRTAELGDSVEYTITVSSPDTTLQGVKVLDRLPAGFRLIPGTVRLNGVSAPDPAGTPGPQLTYTLGTVSQAQPTKITYRVRIAVGSQIGDGINRASASATGGSVSNIAQAVVKVTGGVFTQESCVIGKVFVDCNGDAVQNSMLDTAKRWNFEPGIPGVRVYFENGTFAITDREGKYSVCGFSPSTHVAKVDARTMPAGSVLVPFSNRNIMDGRSVMLDLRSGELHRADFIEGSCKPSILDDVDKRKRLAPPLGSTGSNPAPTQNLQLRDAVQGVKP